ncbi:unnamed protein product, partial (macronuclear) [Paramecium tetraurelia]
MNRASRHSPRYQNLNDNKKQIQQLNELAISQSHRINDFERKLKNMLKKLNDSQSFQVDQNSNQISELEDEKEDSQLNLFLPDCIFKKTDCGQIFDQKENQDQQLNVMSNNEEQFFVVGQKPYSEQKQEINCQNSHQDKVQHTYLQQNQNNEGKEFFKAEIQLNELSFQNQYENLEEFNEILIYQEESKPQSDEKQLSQECREIDNQNNQTDEIQNQVQLNQRKENQGQENKLQNFLLKITKLLQDKDQKIIKLLNKELIQENILQNIVENEIEKLNVQFNKMSQKQGQQLKKLEMQLQIIMSEKIDQIMAMVRQIFRINHQSKDEDLIDNLVVRKGSINYQQIEEYKVKQYELQYELEESSQKNDAQIKYEPSNNWDQNSNISDIVNKSIHKINDQSLSQNDEKDNNIQNFLNSIASLQQQNIQQGEGLIINQKHRKSISDQFNNQKENIIQQKEVNMLDTEQEKYNGVNQTFNEINQSMNKSEQLQLEILINEKQNFVNNFLIDLEERNKIEIQFEQDEKIQDLIIKIKEIQKHQINNNVVEYINYKLNKLIRSNLQQQQQEQLGKNILIEKDNELTEIIQEKNQNKENQEEIKGNQVEEDVKQLLIYQNKQNKQEVKLEEKDKEKGNLINQINQEQKKI